MRLPLYVVDAFTPRVFGGNPAAVVPLAKWLPDATMQAIAAENNLAETAFFVKERGGYHVRWFTPVHEMDLCGHATLASAWVILRYLEPSSREVRFDSVSGPLGVSREGEFLELDFPSRPPERCEVPTALLEGLSVQPREVLASRDYMCVLESEEQVRELKPDFAKLARLDRLGVIVTARGREADFVSRFFAPNEVVPEDPVTGSAHCTLVPYWAQKLGKARLRALQLSPRGGELYCSDRGPRVGIAGQAVLYLEGHIEVP
ncbi:MAG: PhzF family phenazine biosynthesis protein [Myxococcaceae bacterium]|nr:PhzF family phenazine biosynthesis protein [Myxococcaceae bacterium]